MHGPWAVQATGVGDAKPKRSSLGPAPGAALRVTVHVAEDRQGMPDAHPGNHRLWEAPALR